MAKPPRPEYGLDAERYKQVDDELRAKNSSAGLSVEELLRQIGMVRLHVAQEQGHAENGRKIQQRLYGAGRDAG